MSVRNLGGSPRLKIPIDRREEIGTHGLVGRRGRRKMTRLLWCVSSVTTSEVRTMYDFIGSAMAGFFIEGLGGKLMPGRWF